MKAGNIPPGDNDTYGAPVAAEAGNYRYDSVDSIPSSHRWVGKDRDASTVRKAV